MEKEFQFMVDFTLPEILDDEFLSLVPYQRVAIDQLFQEGKLITFALSLEKSRLWAVFSASSEMDVISMIANLPLAEYMKAEISMLSMYNTMNPAMPNFSMN